VRLILGITGNTASGKSLVARRYQEKGCALVDADKVAHDLYAGNRGLVQQLAAEFGPEIVFPNGALDRRRLGSKVFGDPEAMAVLNRIVHPHLLVAVRERVFSALRVMNRVVLDAALIVEWGAWKEVSCLILVSSPEAMRKKRLMEREGLSSDEADRRMRSQIPEEEKRRHADFEIINDADVETLNHRADAVWNGIEAKFAHE
jgi:dephospho-CoA kinase